MREASGSDSQVLFRPGGYAFSIITFTHSIIDNKMECKMLRALSHVRAKPQRYCSRPLGGTEDWDQDGTFASPSSCHFASLYPSISSGTLPPFFFFLFSFFLFAKEKECEKVGRAEKVTNNYINRQGGSPQKDGDEDIKQEPRNQNQHRRPERLKVSLTPHIHTSGHTHPRSPQAQLGWKKKKQHNVTSSYQKGSQ